MDPREISSGKFAIKCPWSEDHSVGVDGDSSTVVMIADDGTPGFKCLHSSHSEKKTRDLTHFLGVEPERFSDWEEIIRLEEVELLEFPINSIPEPLRSICKEASEKIQVPIELPFLWSLSSVSTSLMGKLRVKVFPGYEEPVVLWASPVMASGGRKSPVEKLLSFPLKQWESLEAVRLEPAIKEARSLRKSQESMIRGMRNELTKRDADKDRLLREIVDAEKELVEIPRPIRLVAADITPESLAIVLKQNKGVIALMSDEAGFLRSFFGHYSNGVKNFDILLFGYSVSELRVDRVSREEPILIREPSISIGICPQENVIANIMKSQELRDKGFVARFLFASLESNLGSRTLVETGVPEVVRDSYNKLVTGFLERNKDLEEGELQKVSLSCTRN